jgi:hypothetical protein
MVILEGLSDLTKWQRIDSQQFAALPQSYKLILGTTDPQCMPKTLHI